MGKRKRHPPGYRMDQHQGHKADPVVRLVATHPSKPLVVFAVGTSIRSFDCATGQQADIAGADGAQQHSAVVRFAALSPSGQHLLTGGDDKTGKLWSLEEGNACLSTWRMNKKLSAGTFTPALGGVTYALFADKFGDVAVASAGSADAAAPSSASAAAAGVSAEAELLLGHLCSIVTSVAVSPDSRLVATADKDGRVRISVLPPEPLKGAYEIQTYCQGHKNFVTAAAFVPTGTPAAAPAGEAAAPYLLVTGSGDGTVRVWAPLSGAPLSCYVAAAPRTAAGKAAAAAAVAGEGEGGKAAAAGSEGGEEGQQGEGQAGAAEEDEEDEGEEAQGDGDAAAAAAAEEEEEEEEEGQQAGGGGGGGGGGDEEGMGTDRRDAPDCAAVLDVAVSRDGKVVAVLVEGEHEIQVLSLDAATHQLSLLQRLSVPSVAYPCRAQWDAQGRLWVVGGAPVDVTSSLHVAVLDLTQTGGKVQLQDVTGEVLSAEQRAQLERRDADEEAKLARGELSPLLSKPLQKKTYPKDHVEKRKARRKDLQENQRLAALRAKEQQKKKASSAEPGENKA